MALLLMVWPVEGSGLLEFEVLRCRILPGDHGAGLGLVGGGGGGAQLREAAVARLQARHRTPEVLGAQHLGVVHDFTLVRGDLQGGQNVVNSGQVGGRAGWHVVELPLEDVETWPSRYMRALYTLALLAGEWGFHHAVILTQCPGFVDELHVVASWGCDAVGSQRVFTWRLRGSL